MKTSTTENSQTLSNPRYIAYAKAHGKTPEQMMLLDTMEFTGGCMTGYLLWISEQKHKFQKNHPEHCLGDSIYNQNEWDKFLNVE